MNKPKIKIDVVSDVVCPWCYIGKRRLEKAVAQMSDHVSFEINYLPFELNPALPPEGVNQKEHLSNKFGGEEQYKEIATHISKVALEEGLHFNFEKQKISPNTRRAHRLLWLAKQAGKQSFLKEALMKAYFEDGIDLSKNENLVRLAINNGLDEQKVKALLNSEEGLTEVEQAEQLNHQRGVRGVPFYIINNQYGVSGAQPTESFIEVFNKIIAN